jgi:hypothetical protein
VANQGAHNNPTAHDFARLYFRPRNAFHLRTEGIKCREDNYRLPSHMSVPVMLVFDAASVLLCDGTGFSAGILSRRRSIGYSEAFFARIPFERVYQDAAAAPSEGEALRDRRMAEVVVPGHLPLAPHLRFIVCRFRSVFLHLGLYLRRAEWSDGALRLDFHPPWPHPGEGSYKVTLFNRTPGEDSDSYTLEVPRALSGVRITSIRPSPENCWEIHLEDALAFHAPLPADTWVLA